MANWDMKCSFLKKKVSKTYQAVVNERVTSADVAAFEKGIVFADGYQCQPANLKYSKQTSTKYCLLTIQEGKFHQSQKMFLAQGKKVIALKRLSMGPLELDEQLAVGEYRSLTLAEMKS